MKEILAFTAGVDHPSSRLRIAAYAETFRKHGWRLRIFYFDPGLGKTEARLRSRWGRLKVRARRICQTARMFAALYRLPAGTPIIISREIPVSYWPLSRVQNPLIMDIDDALYLGPGRNKLERLCKRAAAVICGNHTIAGHLSAISDHCLIIPTVVDTNLCSVRTDYATTNSLRIGWMGSSMSIEETLMPFLKQLGELQSRRERSFELVVISDEYAEFLHDIKWASFIKWTPLVERSIEKYIDVGIMPLQDDPFQRSKCGAKLLQYMACGLPVIAIPLGVNRDIVIDGVTGFLASTTEEWAYAIDRLKDHEALRQTLGTAARKHVLEHYSVSVWTEKWISILDEVTREP